MEREKKWTASRIENGIKRNLGRNKAAPSEEGAGGEPAGPCLPRLSSGLVVPSAPPPSGVHGDRPIELRTKEPFKSLNRCHS